MTDRIPRRSFLAGTVAAGTALTLPAAAAPAAEIRECYELRTYRAKNARRLSQVDDYLSRALLPALKRMGLSRIGGFRPVDESDHSLTVLIPYRNADDLILFNDRLAADAAYQKAAADYFSAPLKDPVVVRIENRLMRAFAGMPVLEVPQTKQKSARVFELRIYESHTEHAARLKVEMFNEGEIDIMKDVGLAPVFYGETLVSQDVPNLTYMLSAENAKVHKEHFGAFLRHPDWKRMSGMEKYKGTVSKITSVMLKPTPWSEI